MKILGIDYGSKRVGLAISSEGIAFPRATLTNDAKLVEALVEICKKEKIERVVIGDTKTVSGGANTVTEDALLFKEKTEKSTGLPVEFVWEGWSSMESSLYYGGEGHNDASAAAVILQRYLDGLRTTH